MTRHVLSMLVVNHSGVLTRVSGLFARRGYNIDSLSVGTTEDARFSRVTVSAYGDAGVIEQIHKQVEKLEDVVSVTELKPGDSVCTELVLIKVSAGAGKRSELASLSDIFRADIVDVSKTALTFEMTGEQSKIAAFIELLEPYGIVEIARTGLTGISRGGRKTGAVDPDIKSV